MGSFREVKILVLVLVCLTTCTGYPINPQNSGYRYNGKQDTSGIDKILKTVLVHESTGYGKQSGSISSPNGRNIEVIKRNEHRDGKIVNSGDSYPSQLHTNTIIGNTNVKSVRVFHESTGNTGYIQPHVTASPQVQIVKVLSDEKLSRAISNLASGFIPSRSDQLYGFDSTKRQQQSTLSNGYKYDNPVAGINTGPGFNGYQYQKPFATHNNDLFKQSRPNPGTVAVQAAFLSLAQASQNSYAGTSTPLGNNYQHASSDTRPQSTWRSSDGYQYNIPNRQPESNREANQVAVSQYSNSAQLSSGYQYNTPTSTQGIQQTVSGAGGLQFQNSGYSEPSLLFGASGQQQSNNIGFSYSGPIQSLDLSSTSYEGYRYENPVSKRIPNLPFPFDVKGNKTPVTNGYRHDRPGQDGRPTTTFKGQPYLPIPTGSTGSNGYQNKPPHSAGYGYAKPVESERPTTTFKGQPYLPLSFGIGKEPSANGGNQYNKPDESQRPTSTFKGQSYLPLPLEPTTGSGYQSENPKTTENGEYRTDFNGRPTTTFKTQPYLPLPSEGAAQNDGYRYNKPDQSSRPTTAFKGQPYLPLPIELRNNGYQYESPNDGYRYSKPNQSSRPETAFDVQSFLPTSPASGGL